jgi:hypothetical protein
MADKLCFVVSKGFEKSGAATRALQFASIAAEQGHHIEIFLIDDAVHWAQLGMAEGIRSSTGEHMKDLLDQRSPGFRRPCARGYDGQPRIQGFHFLNEQVATKPLLASLPFLMDGAEVFGQEKLLVNVGKSLTIRSNSS